jgi:hypothetical protein
MSVLLRARLRQAGLFLVLLVVALASNSGGPASAQESAMRWDGLIELITGRYNYPPPALEPQIPADGNSTMSRHATSADGRYILFNSDATNLGYSTPALYLRDRRSNDLRVLLGGPALNGTLSADGNHAAFEICDPMSRPQPRPDGLPICDVYALDLRTWEWRLISATPDGIVGNADSGAPVLSSNGRFVVFRTRANNLTGGAPGYTQLVLRDRDLDSDGIFDEPGTIVLDTISLVGPTGTVTGTGDSDTPEVSDDGRFVAFRSRAPNLVGGDTNLTWDVFLRDRQTRFTRRLNLRGGVAQSPMPIDSPQISMTPDGRFIAYASADPMLAPAVYDDVNGVADVFVHDVWSNTTSRVDLGWGPPIAGGLVPGNGPTTWPTLSADGRYVSVQSAATNVETPPQGGAFHAYVADRWMQTVTRVSVRPDGGDADRDAVRPSISADGSVVTFVSSAYNLATQVHTEAERIYAAVHFELTPSEVLVPGSGGDATFVVTTQQHTQWWMDWTEWIPWWQVTAPPFGVGNGEIRLSVPDPNPDPVRRSYTVRAFAKSALLTQLEGMSLTSISPTAGPASGGTTVTVRGTGFELGNRVMFDGFEGATEFVNSTTLIATTPPRAPGTVWVGVFSADWRQTAWLDNAFRYRDVTPPQVFAFATGEESGGWFRGNANVSFNWLDDESTVTTTTGCTPVVVSADTPGTTFTCSATSEGGTASASITVKRDTAGPSIAITSPPARQLYELGDAAASAFTCSDSLSGVAQCGVSSPSGSPLDTSTPGWHTYNADALDLAGNIGVRTVEYAVSSDVCVANLPTVPTWWRMEGNTRNARSNVPAEATRVGLTADVYVDAIVGQGYQFEGVNGYLSTPFVVTLPGTLRFGMAAWIKPSTNTYGTILRKKDQYSLARTTNGTIAWAFRKFNQPTLSYYDTGVVAPLNAWSHVVVVLQGTEARTYLNGRLAHTATSIGDVYSWQLSEPMTIGGAQDRGEYFKGVIDEVQLFTEMPTASHIEQLFLAGSAGACVPKATHFVWTAPIQATYLSPTYRIELALHDEDGQPIVNRPVQLVSIVGATPLSTSTANRVTDANGSVVWDAPLKNAPPGNYVDYMSATFSGDDEYVRAYDEPTVVVNKALPTITWANPAPITYGATIGAAQLNATANMGGTFAYSPASGTVLGAGPQTLAVTFMPFNSTFYATTTKSVTLTVNQATPTVTVTGGTFPYDGQPHAATGTVRGNGGANLGTPTFTYNSAVDPPTNAGTYDVVGSFAGDTNYKAATATATITIGKATPTLGWNTPAAVVFGTALGDGQLNATANVAGTFAYTPAAGTVLNVGSAQALAATFTPADPANYEAGSVSTTIEVTKATPVVTVNGGSFTYDGQPHAASGSVTGVAGATLEPLTFTYNGVSNAPVNAGVYATIGSFAGDANYEAASGTATITIGKATPLAAWEGPAPIVYGTALGATQLNATANVPGAFVYTPAAGTLLNAGTGHALSAQFTPTDAVNYNAATAATTIDVSKAVATVAVTGGTFTYDGQPHPATGTATGAGGAALAPLTFTYNGQTAAPVSAGSHAVVGSFAGDANHEAASGTATIVIGKAAAVLAWNPPGPIGYGTPLGAAQLAATSNVPGSFAFTPAPGTVLPAGSHALGATFVPADPSNYTTGAIGTTIGVVPAPLSVRANDASKRFGAPLPPFGAAFAGFVNGETPAVLGGALVLGTSATPQSAVGSYPIVPSGLLSSNYSIAFMSGTLSVVKGAVAVSVITSPEPSGAGQPMTFTAALSVVAPAVGTPAGSVQFFDGGALLGTTTVVGATASLTTAGLSAGSHTIEARYLGDASFDPGSGTAPHVVNGSSSTPAITLSSSRNPSNTGQSVTLTANLSMSAGPVAGSVQFWDGATLLGTSNISSNRATLTTSALPNGSHAITARYLGSATAPPAISGVLVQAVGGSSWRNRSTTASVASSANPAALGTTVTFTATIGGSSSSVPTGRVLFMIDGVVVGGAAGIAVTPVSGSTVRAVLPVSGLARGAHKVTVTYLGDTNYKGSTALVTQTVN